MADESKPKAPAEFEIKNDDSSTVQALKATAANLSEHIAKREKHVKTLSGEEAANHQITIRDDKARLDEVKKELKKATK
jgi:hypothetical protein